MVKKFIENMIATIIIIYLYQKLESWNFVLIPFIICGIAKTMKYWFLLKNKDEYVEICNKIFAMGFLLFWFGFLFIWCYIGIINKQYILLLVAIPFFIIGINLFKKKILNSNEKQITTKLITEKQTINILVLMLVIGLLSGIGLIAYGITGIYKINVKTKDFLTTTAYYVTYEIYESDENGETYRLKYKYEVDGQEYIVSTNYGTNYIPKQNSIREVKYNPQNPSQSILVGENGYRIVLFVGIFFILVISAFIMIILSNLGKFDKFRFNILNVYLGTVFIIIGIGVLYSQYGTTQSLIEIFNSFDLLMIIPISFIIVGTILVISGFSNKK